jgi:UDP-N-acetylglucosamine--N-acetylmuramyl-(pentapeptide) pyrophosphoryl-undecaprenol N-acetylglucosamine transferase
MGGSQGASGINLLVARTLPEWAKRAPRWQYLHLTGPNSADTTRQAYDRLGLRAVVRPFLTEMELALNAATAAISRAGASSLAEMAALRVPAVLIPYPAAADNHQYHNAMALVETGAARMVIQAVATPEMLAGLTHELMENQTAAETVRKALAKWHQPGAAENIADRMWAFIRPAGGAAEADDKVKPLVPMAAIPGGSGRGAAN